MTISLPVPLPVITYIKNDGNYLYIAADDPNDSNIDTNNEIAVYFDEDHNHTWDPDSLTGEGNFWTRELENIFRGIYGDYPNTLGFTPPIFSPPGVVSGVSNTSGHLQYEASFDLTTSELNTTPGSTIGFMMFVYDPETGQYSELAEEKIKREIAKT